MLGPGKLANRFVKSIGALLARADALCHRSAEAGILKVVKSGLDQLPQL